jgi:hypothetical protein
MITTAIGYVIAAACYIADRLEALVKNERRPSSAEGVPPTNPNFSKTVAV